MVHPIANIWGGVCFTKSKVCHDVMRRLLAGVPKGKRPSASPEDGVRRSARSFPQLGSLQSLDPALEEMMTLGSNKH